MIILGYLLLVELVYVGMYWIKLVNILLVVVFFVYFYFIYWCYWSFLVLFKYLKGYFDVGKNYCGLENLGGLEKLGIVYRVKFIFVMWEEIEDIRVMFYG